MLHIFKNKLPNVNFIPTQSKSQIFFRLVKKVRMALSDRSNKDDSSGNANNVKDDESNF